MRRFVLNDAEIAHILELRALPEGQKDAIISATRELSHVHPHLVAVNSASVLQLVPRSID